MHSTHQGRCELRAVSRALAVLGWLGAITAANANPYFVNIGPSLTLGPGLNRANLQSANHNPANAAQLVGPEESFRVGALSFGGRYELGAVNDVWRTSKDMQDVIDNARADGSAAAVKSAALRVDSEFLPLLEKSARGVGQFAGGIVSPVLWRSGSIPGVWSFNLDGSGTVGSSMATESSSVLIKFSSADPRVNGSKLNISINGLADQIELLKDVKTAQDQYAALGNLASQVSADQQDVLRALLDSTLAGQTVNTTLAVTSATAFDVRAANVARASVGYAADVTDALPGLARALGTEGRLNVGLRASALQATLYRQTLALVDKDGNSTTVDFASNDKFKKTRSGGTLDIGANWVAPNYQFGLTAYNLVPLRLEYPNPLRDPNATNAAAALQLVKLGKIKADEPVRIEAQGMFEAAVYSADHSWMLQMASALNKTVDFAGQQIQPVSLGLSYNPDYRQKQWSHWLAPSFRLGYHQNLAGTKLDGIGLGGSLGPLNFDLFSGIKQLKIDGKSIPQTFGFSMSIAEVF